MASKIRPSYITDDAGRRTHVVLTLADWDRIRLQPVEPDAWDLEAMARIARLTPEDLQPVAVTNPIRLARHEAGVSQAELARRMGLSPGMLSRMEREGRWWRATTLARALEALARDRP